jgi:hypothetical protein
MDLSYIINSENIYYHIILKNSNLVDNINLLKCCKDIYKILNNDTNFWFNCCLIYKSKFFFDLNMLRTDNSDIFSFKKNDYKQVLRNLYFRDSIIKTENEVKKDIIYFYQWIMMEYYNDRINLCYKMLSCIYNEYFKKKKLIKSINNSEFYKELILLYNKFENIDDIYIKKKLFEKIMGKLELFCI